MPKVTVEIAFASGFSTPLADRVYTDVSDYVEGEQSISITHGRDDELSSPAPGRCSLTLDNRDGRFTPEKSSSPYYPNVKKGKPIRVSVRYPATQVGNFLTANAASFETSVAAWSVFGGATIVQSATHVQTGSQAMRITWPTTSGVVSAYTDVTGLVVGRAYIASAYVWVTAGTPAVAVDIGGIGSGTASSTTGAFQRISKTFTATAATHAVGIVPTAPTTAGQQVWVDAVMLDEGSTLGTFTTASPPIYIRYTGYIDEWPLTWPDGSDKASYMTISASTRRARLGNNAPLKSAIREAYLATDPHAVWPLNDDLVNRTGQSVFRDITNPVTQVAATQLLAGFFNSTTYAPQLNTGVQGPTDEGEMVFFPATPTSTSAYERYVGGGGVMNILTTGFASAEMVARINPVAPPVGQAVDMVLFRVGSAGLNQEAYCFVYDDSHTGGGQWVGLYLLVRDSDGTILEQAGYYVIPGQEDAYSRATDGELHHFLLNIYGGDAADLFLDGELIAGAIMATETFTATFTNVVIGNIGRHANMYASWMAVHDRHLLYAGIGGSEIEDRAAAAIAADETPEERVVRVAGRIGVPADEVDVEATVARDLGSQPEAGRSATEILDEVATSTGGVLYDSRDGRLTMQARNHRYNVAVALTLNATTQEIQGDLAGVDDHRYTKNTIEYARSGTEDIPATVVDQDSIDEYGVFNPGAYTVVTESQTEAEGFAADLLYRYADPGLRVDTVAVDLVNLSDAQQALMLAADIGTRMTISALPTQAPATTMTLFLEGYSESITATTHALSMNTTPGDLYQNIFTLDDPVLGQLDVGNVIAY